MTATERTLQLGETQATRLVIFQVPAGLQSVKMTMSGLGRCVTVLLMLLLHCCTAIDRLQLFPFGAPQGDERMDVGDDVSSPEVQLRTPVVFYDDFFSSLYVSAYGCLSLAQYSNHAMLLYSEET